MASLTQPVYSIEECSLILSDFKPKSTQLPDFTYPKSGKTVHQTSIEILPGVTIIVENDPKSLSLGEQIKRYAYLVRDWSRSPLESDQTPGGLG